MAFGLAMGGAALGESPEPGAAPGPGGIPAEAISAARQDYQRNVAPIFKQKCFDCHSRFTRYPWYSAIPGVSWLIERDIREARANLDMTEDFPFLGKGTPADYLDVIEDVLRDESMPPWRYQLMHTASRLTEGEKQQVLRWIKAARLGGIKKAE